MDYTFYDLLAIFGEDQKQVLVTLDNHIKVNYPLYKPFDIKSKNKNGTELVCNYHKKPKVGKPICNIIIYGEKLLIQFVFLSDMVREILLKQCNNPIIVALLEAFLEFR